MASLNKVLLIGNLTRDPELRYSKSGTAICSFGLAINRRFKGANGVETNDTCFVDIVVWGAQGENADRYLKKGSAAFIEGRLQMDQWEDKESGQRRSRLQVVAELIQFLSSSRTEREEGEIDESPRPVSNTPPQKSAWNGGAHATRAESPPPKSSMPMPERAFQVESDDNIPF